jgi:FkbM family methyltransferase
MYNKYHCNIYAFEPTTLYEKCKVKVWDKPKVKLINKAAYTYDGNLKLGIDDNEASIYHEENTIDVECVDFKKFLIDNNINNIDLIKINIEGAEYPLLIDLINFGMIKIFKNLQIQFHIISGFEREYNWISEKLSETHTITWRYPFIWENWKKK